MKQPGSVIGRLPLKGLQAYFAPLPTSNGPRQARERRNPGAARLERLFARFVWVTLQVAPEE